MDRGSPTTPPTSSSSAAQGVDEAGRWTRQRAWQWQALRPWLCGANFMPSTAVNWIEMWQRSSFDPTRIAQELDWAAGAAMNSVRFVLPFIVWTDDPDGLLDRVDHVLSILSDRSMSALPCLLDDCEFSDRPPRLGPQPDPVPGLHNSAATGSPGRALVMDEGAWPDIEHYAAQVVRAFADDDRIAAWDVYNEPGNRVIFTPDGARWYEEALEHKALELLHRVFRRIRDVAPSQPLTAAAWRVPPPDEEFIPYDHPVDTAAFELSDVVSFHAYCSAGRMRRAIEHARSYQRPMLCTEWMGRQAESRIAEQLPLLRREGVGSYIWGLVRGRSQTHLPWPDFLETDPGEDERGRWFHDLLDTDGTPHDEEEIEVLRRQVELSAAAAGESPVR